jgi:hypothetical protein
MVWPTAKLRRVLLLATFTGLDDPRPRRSLDMRKQFLITAFSGLVAALVLAGPAHANVNKRQAHQQQRIAKGISNGSLTAHEAAGLERQQAHIARYEARNRADGNGLNRNERARLRVMQDRASRSIHNQRRDGQRR